jgi:hypothetical protein
MVFFFTAGLAWPSPCSPAGFFCGADFVFFSVDGVFFAVAGVFFAVDGGVFLAAGFVFFVLAAVVVLDEFAGFAVLFAAAFFAAGVEDGFLAEDFLAAETEGFFFEPNSVLLLPRSWAKTVPTMNMIPTKTKTFV